MQQEMAECNRLFFSFKTYSENNFSLLELPFPNQTDKQYSCGSC